MCLGISKLAADQKKVESVDPNFTLISTSSFGGSSLKVIEDKETLAQYILYRESIIPRVGK